MTDQKARLEPLKTLHSVRASEEFGNAWVIEIPTQLANQAWSLLKPLVVTVPGLPTLLHLRRLSQKQHLPAAFRGLHGIPAEKNGTIFFLLPPSPLVTEESLGAALKRHIKNRDDLPKLFTTTVPTYPPTTAEQAAALSKNYWPCIYNPASQTVQQAPPLNLLRTTQTELDTPRLDAYMKLAVLVGRESLAAGVGRGVGAVLVDPVRNEVIATAGDARWWTHNQVVDHSIPEGAVRRPNEGRRTEGRPENHALMRAVAMVASKELRLRNDSSLPSTDCNRVQDLGGRSLNQIERSYFIAPEQRSWDGSSSPKQQSCPRLDPYLCNGLDLYLTHEPCACCSMAMIHSRIRACVFVQSMPGTGGLQAETEDGGLGYGLFWRKELNWRTMAFQYRQMDLESAALKSGGASFNA